jgi:hypothetical protein
MRVRKPDIKVEQIVVNKNELKIVNDLYHATTPILKGIHFRNRSLSNKPLSVIESESLKESNSKFLDSQLASRYQVHDRTPTTQKARYEFECRNSHQTQRS